jgi:hypothetical protein
VKLIGNYVHHFREFAIGGLRRKGSQQARGEN